ncbi:unnamed protein product, partial [Oikopleura dioica]
RLTKFKCEGKPARVGNQGFSCLAGDKPLLRELEDFLIPK